MGKSINVISFEEMAASAGKLKTASENYTELSNRLMQEAGSMGAAWEGADNQAFVEQISGFAEDLKLMAARLQSAGEALDRQRANYAARQDVNLSAVRQLVN